LATTDRPRKNTPAGRSAHPPQQPWKASETRGGNKRRRILGRGAVVTAPQQVKKKGYSRNSNTARTPRLPTRGRTRLPACTPMTPLTRWRFYYHKLCHCRTAEHLVAAVKPL